MCRGTKHPPDSSISVTPNVTRPYFELQIYQKKPQKGKPNSPETIHLKDFD
jgi:hypothetical protein